MRIAIFGATGRTGILTVYQALDKGHIVTAYARNPSKVTITHRNITVIQGELSDYERIKEAVAGQDAVICTLGVYSRKPSTILSDGTRNIVKAMEEYSVKRLICLSSVGLLGNDAGFLFGRIIIPLFLDEEFKDKKRQMKVIWDSGLEWIIIRPSFLTDAPKTGKYRITAHVPLSRNVPRADVADFMLKLLTDKQYDGQMPAISS
jgi:putative NADH-flavin reductase